MRAFCVFALLLAGASGEISGCVADADAPNTCHGDVPLGDSTNLLQVKVMERAQDESEAAALTQTAALTRRCSEGAHTGRDDCKLDDWSSWTACRNGTRTRSRTVLSLAAHDGLCGCTEEAETCNDDACIMGDWSAWTSCSKTCGSGMRSRSRKVLSVKDKEGTCPCLEDSETCNAAPCTTTTTTTQEPQDDDTTGGALKPQLVKEHATCGPRGKLLTTTAGDISDCGALAEGAGFRAFAFGVKFQRGTCYAMTLSVNDALCDEWDKNRANPRCPTGEWKADKYFDFYALETLSMD